MSYPGPPGISSNQSSHPSLPPRPPSPPKLPSGFRPAFPPTSSSHSPTPNPPYSPAPGPGYNATGLRYYGSQKTTSSYPSYPQPPTVAGGATTYQHLPSPSYSQQNYAQTQTYHGAPGSSYSTPPQIRNPFPVPTAGGDYDPEMAAQIAQWQSAYMPKDAADPFASKGAAGGRGGGNAAGATGIAAAPTADATKAVGPAEFPAPATTAEKKTVFREGGGKKWADDTLLEWDPSHLRLFVGNLAGETTDESLLKAFARWGSVQKAKVVRDKRTNKSKGYGFVSFSDPDDFFQAAKEMNGKYIQSHPVVVHKAKTEIKPQGVKDDRGRGKNQKKSGAGNKAGSGSGRRDGGTGYEPHLGPAGGGGIAKPGQKTKGGLKLLG